MRTARNRFCNTTVGIAMTIYIAAPFAVKKSALITLLVRLELHPDKASKVCS
jgi:hypothetical protein